MRGGGESSVQMLWWNFISRVKKCNKFNTWYYFVRLYLFNYSLPLPLSTSLYRIYYCVGRLMAKGVHRALPVKLSYPTRIKQAIELHRELTRHPNLYRMWKLQSSTDSARPWMMRKFFFLFKYYCYELINELILPICVSIEEQCVIQIDRQL